jgi:hypothetical protein
LPRVRPIRLRRTRVSPGATFRSRRRDSSRPSNRPFRPCGIRPIRPKPARPKEPQALPTPSKAFSLRASRKVPARIRRSGTYRRGGSRA